MKLVKFELNGKTYHLCFNGAAMFEINEILEGESPVNIILKNDKKSFLDMCKIVAVLSEQGEAVRRYLGYDSEPIIGELELEHTATPTDVINMKNSAMKAIAIGYGKEIDEDEEIDLGLIELQKKTED